MSGNNYGVSQLRMFCSNNWTAVDVEMVVLREILEHIDMLENAVRKHRDMAPADRCFHDDEELYLALGEPIPAGTGQLPDLKRQLIECVNYCFSRASSYAKPGEPRPAGIYRRFDVGAKVMLKPGIEFHAKHIGDPVMTVKNFSVTGFGSTLIEGDAGVFIQYLVNWPDPENPEKFLQRFICEDFLEKVIEDDGRKWE